MYRPSRPPWGSRSYSTLVLKDPNQREYTTLNAAYFKLSFCRQELIFGVEI